MPDQEVSGPVEMLLLVRCQALGTIPEGLGVDLPLEATLQRALQTSMRREVPGAYG